MIAEIFVRTTKVATHYWPNAPEHRHYLRNPHRHVFHIEARCDVMHDNREVEFHDLLDAVNELWLFLLGTDVRHRSCEMMAKTLCDGLIKRYERPFSVSVSEDGECGAIVRQMA